MRKLVAVALNEIRVFFSVKSNLVTMVLLPVLFSFIIGFISTGGAPAPGTDARMPVAVVVQEQSSLAEAIFSSLESSQAIRPLLMDEQEAQRKLGSGTVLGMLVVPTTPLEQLFAGEHATWVLQVREMDNVGLAVREAVQAALAEVERPILAAQASAASAEALGLIDGVHEKTLYTADGLELAGPEGSAQPVTVQVEQGAAREQVVIGGFTLSSPGQLVTWVLSTLLSAGVALVMERTSGTLRRLMVMPASRAVILAGKVLGWLLLGLVQIAMLVLFGMVALNVNWGRSPAALVMVSVSYALAATALGTVIATVSKTTAQAGGLVTLGVFLLAPLGGCWIPLEITPPAFQTAAQVLPTTWAMRGFMDVVARGQGPGGVLLETVVLLGFAIVFFAIGLWRFRYE